MQTALGLIVSGLSGDYIFIYLFFFLNHYTPVSQANGWNMIFYSW